eukprot:jgi/Chlat1/331/Chrsp1S03193
MKFGKRLRDSIEDALPEWRSNFLCYKELKKSLKKLSQNGPAESPAGSTNGSIDMPCDRMNGSAVPNGAIYHHPRSIGASSLTEDEKAFVRMLNDELEKFNQFFMDKEEEFVIHLKQLDDHLAKLQSDLREDCELDDREVNGLRKSYVEFHGEMVLLENYSLLNYTGLVKILKKHDKRTGLLLRSPYLANVLKQPFYTTEILTRLVRKAEASFQQVLNLTSAAAHTEVVPAKEQFDLVSLPASMTDESCILKSSLSALRTLQELRPAQFSSAATSVAVAAVEAAVADEHSEGDEQATKRVCVAADSS